MLRPALSIATVATVVVTHLAPSALAQNTVWVVDDDGGAGVAFTDLESAVSTVADGDTLLVRGGDYGGFSLNDKGLTIVADVGGGPIKIDDGLAIRNLASHRRVVLHGLVVNSGSEAGLQIKSCSGQVWVENCTLKGAQGDGAFTGSSGQEDGSAGVYVSFSASVALLGCTIEGGAGSDYAPLVATNGDGGHGLEIVDSDVAAYDCTITGGRGGHIADDDAAWNGGDGGNGIDATGGDLHLSGGSAAGGGGGIGGEDFDIFIGFTCGVGGNGGNGLRGSNGGQPLAIDRIETQFIAGAFGPGFGGCSGGLGGVPLDLRSGALNTLTSRSYGMSATCPVRDGNAISIDVTGQPGSAFVVGLAALPDQVPAPFLNGVVLLDANVVLLPAGAIGANGTAALTLATNAGVPAAQGLAAYAQGVFLAPGSFAPVLGTAAALLVLHPAL